jgi:hypothetical protein
MECSIQLGCRLVEWTTFHLSPHENILTIALINIHYLHNSLQRKYCLKQKGMGAVKEELIGRELQQGLSS